MCSKTTFPIGNRLRTALAFSIACLSFATFTANAAKTDIIYLDNGDRITCEIKSLDRAQLKVSTDSMGTIYIDWDDIAHIASDQSLQIELDSGERKFGKLPKSEDAGYVNVKVLDESELVPMDQVVRVQPLEIDKKWYHRLDGSISAGLDFAKANNLLTTNLAADVKTRTRRNVWEGRASWNLTTQDIVADIDRANLSASYQRLLDNRWFWTVLAAADRNSELGIDLRVSTGGGIGRYFRQTNHATVGLTGALVVINEQTTSTVDDTTYLSGLIRAQWAVFRYKSPEINFFSSLNILPTLSDLGRVRSQLTVDLRKEFIADLFFNVNLYYTYDNEPPAGAASDDYGLITSLGYSF